MSRTSRLFSEIIALPAGKSHGAVNVNTGFGFHGDGCDGCYHIRAVLPDEEALNRLLDEILQFGNYRLQLSIAKIKQGPS
jgi:hypothetical protein